MEKLPNFFIVGPPRSGTTSLWEYLKIIPGVFMSPVKEPNYFNPNFDGHGFSATPVQDEQKISKSV